MNDHEQIREIERKIHETVAAINALVPAYALARQVIDYDADRRKQLLARFVNCDGPLKVSMAMAESAARSNVSYGEQLDKLAKELKSAYEVQAKWQALMARLDAARSLMAVTRETLKQMPE